MAAGQPAAAAGQPATATGKPATTAGQPATATGKPAAAAGQPAAAAGQPAPAAAQSAPAAAQPAPATKYWLKLKLDTGGGKTVLSGKAWLDSATEPDWQLIQEDWVWPPTAASPLLPSLCGGIYANGKNEISVAFDNICIEAFAPTTTGSSFLGSPPAGPSLASLIAPRLDDEILIPDVAFSPAMTGRWGTLIGLAEPDPPIPVACVEPPCPWPRPTASTNPCCSTSTAAAGMEVSRTIPLEGVPAHCAPTSGTPAGPIAPASSSATGGETMPENRPPQPDAPKARLSRITTRNAEIRTISYRPDEPGATLDTEPATAPGQPPAPNPPVSANQPPFNAGLRLIPLRTNRQILRDHGAVATVPDPPNTPDTLKQAWDNFVDKLLFELKTKLTNEKKIPLDADLEKAWPVLIEAVKNLQPAWPAEIKHRALARIEEYKQGAIAPIFQGWDNLVDELLSGLAADLMKQRKITLTTDPERIRQKLIDAVKNVQPPLPAEIRWRALQRIEEYNQGVPRSPIPEAAAMAPMDSHVAMAPRAGGRSFFSMAGPSTQLPPSRSPSSLGPGAANPPGSQGAVPISHDPFSVQPRISVITIPTPDRATQVARSNPDWRPDPMDQSQPDALASQPEADDLTDDKSSRVWTYHFDHPARFPKAEFGTACCAFEGEGAIIHEGMRVLAREDGQYEVRFNITTPPTPVLLRLQLILFPPDPPDKNGGQPIPRTLTLPPISLRPWGSEPYLDDSRAGNDPVSYLVRLRGYSQIIKEVQTDNGSFLLVKRIGTARFGSGVRIQANQ